MSRLYTRNSRGRQPMLGGSTTRFSKTKENPNDTYRQAQEKKNKINRRQAVTKRLVGKRKRIEISSSEGDDSSTLGSDTADDASDEDSDEADEEDDEEEDDDLPAVMAPSRSRNLNGAGRKIHSTLGDSVSIAGSMDSMFGDFDGYYEEDDDPRLSPEENRKRFESQVFAESDDDNDELYQAVDEISDSEDGLDDHRIEEQELLAMLSEEDNSDADFLLNQIDGLSAYGFGGDDSDGSIHRFPSSQGSDSANEAGNDRHVHFAVENDRSMFLRMSESPTITRALLPSALPASGFPNRGAERHATGLVDDLDDCMLQLDLPVLLR